MSADSAIPLLVTIRLIRENVKADASTARAEIEGAFREMNIPLGTQLKASAACNRPSPASL
jgi:hypothetical protein